eukprot:scaffold88161_cov22-Cyclotella_meneghiniana.AAC.2
MKSKLALLNQRTLTIERWAKDLSRHLLLFTRTVSGHTGIPQYTINRLKAKQLLNTQWSMNKSDHSSSYLQYYYHHNTDISSQKKIVPHYSKVQPQQNSFG